MSNTKKTEKIEKPEKTEKIGGVTLNYEFLDESHKYSDGDEVEEFLVSVFKEGRDIIDVLSKDDRWPVLYHLSPRRANITNPMDIKPTDDVLEIGAGFGAVTAPLAKKASTLDCIELSKRRALGNAYRNKDAKNMTIYVGPFSDIELNKKYDVVVLVGVLEYSGLYVGGNDPYAEFMRIIFGLLKPNGRVYIAIENRLGLKYFSGAPEDHLAIPYVGIDGYRNPECKVRTFSRSELATLVTSVGFAEPFFYYPLPDYKLPRIIYSDAVLPRKSDEMPPLTPFDMDRVSVFDEMNALRTLIGTDEFKYFANSFLLEAKKL